MGNTSKAPADETVPGTNGQRGPSGPPEGAGGQPGEASDPPNAAIEKGLKWLFEKLRGDRR